MILGKGGRGRGRAGEVAGWRGTSEKKCEKRKVWKIRKFENEEIVFYFYFKDLILILTYNFYYLITYYL